MKTDSNQPREVRAYDRCSTSAQLLGNSKARQGNSAEAFARKHGFRLVGSLSDHGLSGYTGAHRRKGKLGRFIEDVKRGNVKKGTILFVEDIDRLSREGIKEAFKNVVFELFDHGISLGLPDHIYEADKITDEELSDLAADLRRARRESARKSQTSGDNWERRRADAAEDGHYLSKRAPAWLEYNSEQNKFVAKAGAAEAIRYIFAQIEVLGVTRIVSNLNRNDFWRPPPTKEMQVPGWGRSYVKKILKNRAVLGECQAFTKRNGEKRRPIGSPMVGKYEAVITEDVFNRAQQSLSRRTTKTHSGRTGDFLNVFRGLVKCGYCGGSMVQRNRGQGPKGGLYLTCERGERATSPCRAHAVRYDELLKTVLPNCSDLQPEEILVASQIREEQRASLHSKIMEARARIEGCVEKRENLMTQLENSKAASLRMAYETRIIEHEAEKTRAEKLLADLDEQMRLTQAGPSFVREWQANLKSLFETISPRTAVEARMRLNSQLKSFISSIETFGKGPSGDNIVAWTPRPKKLLHIIHSENRRIPIYEARSTVNPAFDLLDYADAVLDECSLSPRERSLIPHFLKFLRTRQGTRHERFFKVTFTSGISLDFAPAGSLAISRVLTDERSLAEEDDPYSCYERCTPDIEYHWTAFLKMRSA